VGQESTCRSPPAPRQGARDTSGWCSTAWPRIFRADRRGRGLSSSTQDRVHVRRGGRFRNAGHYHGRQHFTSGIREHAMGGAIRGGIVAGPKSPLRQRLLIFSAYGRPRLSLGPSWKYPSIYVFTPRIPIGVGRGWPDAFSPFPAPPGIRWRPFPAASRSARPTRERRRGLEVIMRTPTLNVAPHPVAPGPADFGPQEVRLRRGMQRGFLHSCAEAHNGKPDVLLLANGKRGHLLRRCPCEAEGRLNIAATSWSMP